MRRFRLPPTFIVATPSFPPLDDAALFERKRERPALVDRAVELLPFPLLPEPPV